ncbi:MAG: SCO family protein [bacterium]|nr:SCO family protein [bacterium]
MARNKTAGRQRKVGLAFLLMFAPAFLLIFISTRSCSHKFEKLPDYGEVSSYTFIDANGKKRSSKEFKGEIILVTTIQPTCPNNCAVALGFLKLHIYKILAGKKGIRIISFVTDENGEPLEDLTATQQMLEDEVLDYDPDLWILASGDPSDIYDIEKGDRKLIEELEKEDLTEYGYKSMMLLLDRDNHLRMIRSGKEEGMVRQMKQHIALLKKEYDIKEYEETH